MTGTTALRNARLIDGIADQPHERVPIVIEGERITAITQDDGPSGPNVEVIDCAGKILCRG